MAKKTAGELSLKAASDNAIYDPLELGIALSDDVAKQLEICANKHTPIFDEDEFFIVLQIASDPLLAEVRRHKYAAFIHMPKPRPSQSCFLFNKITQTCRRLWSLPNALVMAKISEMPYVAPKWQLTKMWCDAFYNGWQYDPATDKIINKNESHFFNVIRNYYGIKHLSEKEFLEANSEKIVKTILKDSGTGDAETFDFSKFMT